MWFNILNVALPLVHLHHLIGRLLLDTGAPNSAYTSYKVYFDTLIPVYMLSFKAIHLIIIIYPHFINLS